VICVIPEEVLAASQRMILDMAYKRAPITEAVIELRFAQSFAQETVEAAAKRLAPEYFYQEPETAMNLTIDASTQKTTGQTSWLGVKLSSLDRADVLIFRTTSFICSRLAPYPGWEVFSARAAHAWDVWKKAASRTELTRIGVRYVNRIDIPLEGNALIRVEDYLNVRPQSPELGEPMSSYAMQIVKPLGADDCGLILHSSTIPSPLVGFASFALDLDIFREMNLPMRDDGLWALVNKIRAHKNSVFESCVTDRARGLFDQ
jgi:uncharacterized protein (TIGR04255 family)